ncbi:TetR family transcriptional regulator [Mesorhizobium sp. A556]
MAISSCPTPANEISDSGVDVSQSTIVAKAGVSRQTIYFAFGGRAGLLIAMLHNKDAHSQ